MLIQTTNLLFDAIIDLDKGFFRKEKDKQLVTNADNLITLDFLFMSYFDMTLAAIICRQLKLI